MTPCTDIEAPNRRCSVSLHSSSLIMANPRSGKSLMRGGTFDHGFGCLPSLYPASKPACICSWLKARGPRVANHTDLHSRRLPVRVRYKDVSHAHPFQALRLSLIDARHSLSVFSPPSAHPLGWLPFPRFAGVTRARYLLLGATKSLPAILSAHCQSTGSA